MEETNKLVYYYSLGHSFDTIARKLRKPVEEIKNDVKGLKDKFEIHPPNARKNSKYYDDEFIDMCIERIMCGFSRRQTAIETGLSEKYLKKCERERSINLSNCKLTEDSEEWEEIDCKEDIHKECPCCGSHKMNDVGTGNEKAWYCMSCGSEFRKNKSNVVEKLIWSSVD